MDTLEALGTGIVPLGRYLRSSPLSMPSQCANLRSNLQSAAEPSSTASSELVLDLVMTDSSSGLMDPFSPVKPHERRVSLRYIFDSPSPRSRAETTL